MKVCVDLLGRHPDRSFDVLVVTSEATFCRAKVDCGTGFVSVYGGTVWPGSLPMVFEKRGSREVRFGRPYASYLKADIFDHFQESVAGLTFEQPVDSLRGRRLSGCQNTYPAEIENGVRHLGGI